MAPLNVTPMKMNEVLFRIVQDPERKHHIENFGRQYAMGQVDKDQLLEMTRQVVSPEEMTTALRILVPGYDEMCGNAPPKKEEKELSLKEAAALDISDAAEKAAAEKADKASAPKLKKGFLAGGKSIEDKNVPKPAVMPPKPAPKIDDDTVDPHLFREQYHQQMHESMPTFDQSTQEHMVHNNFVMHDAEHAGNGGNVTIGPDGRAKMRTDDELGGADDKYTWGQNESEITIKVKVPAGTKGKEVSFHATSVRLKLVVRGELIVDGALHAPVLGDDSTYVVEDDPEETASGGRLVVVTLAKRDKTGGHTHWPCVVAGAPRIDTKGFGPQCITANPDNPQAVIEAMKLLEPGKQRAQLENKVI